MKTEKLRDIVNLLKILNANNEPLASRIIRAQQELSELQSIVDVVKGFIEDNEIRGRNDIFGACEEHNCPANFIDSLCNIVGYKE